MIEKKDLIKGQYYLGKCRNSQIAMWDGKVFIYLKQHFDSYVKDSIEHYSDVKDSCYDGFIPIKKNEILDYNIINSEKDVVDYKNVYRKIYKNKSKDDLKGEIWLDIPGYEGLYKISNLGRVKNKNNTIMSQVFNSGYLVLGLTKDKVQKNIRVHRLVALAFIGDSINEKNEVNHKNGIKTDNREKNLEWVTRIENARLMYQNGIFNKKLTIENVKNIRDLIKKGNITQMDIAKKFNISQSIISEIKNNKKWVI